MNSPIFNGAIFYLFPLFTIYFLTACSVESTDFPSSDKGLSDDDHEILDALYRDKRTPPNFYTEEFPDDVFTSLGHVKSVILSNDASDPVYELSTDDFSEALEFSEIEANLQPVYKQMVDVTETELYFQFTRVNLDYPEFVHFSRVFKQSALDRSGVDRSQPGSYQGRIALPQLTARGVEDIIEYLWNFTFNNNYGNTVIESEIAEFPSEFVHTMIEAKLVISSMNSCDTVEVVESLYTISRDSGFMWKESMLIREIAIQRDNTGFYLCQI